MPPQRLQIGSGIQSPALATPAAPVDTFVKPAAGYQLEQLAQGLAKLEPSLGQLSDVITQRENKQNYEAGVAKAAELYANFQDVTKAMKAGQIQANQNPWFMAGLREQFGRVAADRMNFEMLAAMNTDETLKNSTDVRDFDSFATNFISNWEQNNLTDVRDPNFERGFASKTDAYLSDTQRQWASQLGDRAMKQMNEAHYADVTNTIANELRRGTSMDAIAKEIDTSAQGRIRLGVNGGQINRTTVAAVIGAAEDLAGNGDDRAFQVLDLLKAIPGGPAGTGPLARQAYGQQPYDEAVTRVSQRLQDYQNRVALRDERERKQQVDNVWANMITNSVNDPTYDIQGDLTKIAFIDRSSVVPSKSAWDAIFKQDPTTDPTVYASLFNQIWNDPDRTLVTPATIARALMNRKLSRSDAAGLVSEWKRAHDSGAELLLNETPIQKGIETLTATLQQQVGGARFMTDEDAQKLNKYAAHIRSAYITFRQTDGQGSTYIQREDFVKRQVQDVLSAIQMENNGVMTAGAAGATRNPTANPTFKTPPHTESGGVTPEERHILLTDGALHHQMTPALQGILKKYNVPNTPADVQAFIQKSVSQH